MSMLYRRRSMSMLYRRRLLSAGCDLQRQVDQMHRRAYEGASKYQPR
jgi:hypothetical protein